MGFSLWNLITVIGGSSVCYAGWHYLQFLLMLPDFNWLGWHLLWEVLPRADGFLSLLYDMLFKSANSGPINFLLGSSVIPLYCWSAYSNSCIYNHQLTWWEKAAISDSPFELPKVCPPRDQHSGTMHGGSEQDSHWFLSLHPFDFKMDTGQWEHTQRQWLPTNAWWSDVHDIPEVHGTTGREKVQFSGTECWCLLSETVSSFSLHINCYTLSIFSKGRSRGQLAAASSVLMLCCSAPPQLQSVH